MLRSPAEFYYKFLLVHPDGHDNFALKALIAERGIDWISNEYVNRLRCRMRLPVPFFPKDPSHQPSTTFLLAERISHLFQPDNEMKAALALLEVPRAREFVETMLLSHAPLEAIAKAVTRYGCQCTRRVIERYAHHFWNVDLLDSTQMKVFLNWRFEHSADSLPEALPEGCKVGDEQWEQHQERAHERVRAEMALATVRKKASYQDPRKLAAELPFSPFAALLVQMRMGMMPDRIDVATRMVATRDMATMRALESLHATGPGDAGRAFNYAMTAKIMNELLETVQKPDEQLREQLSAIALRTDDRPVPSIHQLSGGRHTVDMQPTPEGTYEPEPLEKPVDGG